MSGARTFTTYAEAAAALPVDAVWSSSFGYGTEGGYTEFHRQPDGTRWTIDNGPYQALRMGDFTWTLRRVPAPGGAA